MTIYQTTYNSEGLQTSTNIPKNGDLLGDTVALENVEVNSKIETKVALGKYASNFIITFDNPGTIEFTVNSLKTIVKKEKSRADKTLRNWNNAFGTAVVATVATAGSWDSTEEIPSIVLRSIEITSISYPQGGNPPTIGIILIP